jgi:transketolase C-terminal domain/subunit
VLRPPGDVLFVAAGPVMVSGGWHAAEQLAGDGVEAGVVALPWLRGRRRRLAGGGRRRRGDRHARQPLPRRRSGRGGAGGTGRRCAGPASRVHQIGVTEIPKSGENNEVLHAHGLDAEGIAASVRLRLQALEPSA